MKRTQQIFCCCFLLVAFSVSAQQNYNPFQYALPPNPIQAPQVLTLQQQRTQQQIALQQQNYQQMMKMGITPPPSQADINAAWQKQRQGQAPPPNQQQKVQAEMNGLLEEIRKANKVVISQDYYKSPEFINDVPNYVNAQELIKNMLEGKIPLSLKDAYYFTEFAYGDVQLSYDEYNKLIASNASFIKQWLKQNKYDINNPEALHFGIQSFISDTLFVTLNGKKQGHLPYYYDYIDARAKDDKRNYYVTKTLATGSGQCHTLPVLYLLFAEALGIDACMAFNPQHSFIQYRNNKGTVVNYETTVDRFLPNSFYLETLPVMAQSQKNKVYLNSLDKKLVVATTLYLLADNFLQEHYLGDKSFIKECLAIADPYFPDQTYICIERYNVQKVLYADVFNDLVQAKGIKNLSDIEKYPDVLSAYNAYYGFMNKISSLGIQDFPESEYLRMLKYYDVKSKLQISKNLNAKTKKSLFIN